MREHEDERTVLPTERKPLREFASRANTIHPVADKNIRTIQPGATSVNDDIVNLNHDLQVLSSEKSYLPHQIGTPAGSFAVANEVSSKRRVPWGMVNTVRSFSSIPPPAEHSPEKRISTPGFFIQDKADDSSTTVPNFKQTKSNAPNPNSNILVANSSCRTCGVLYSKCEVQQR
ncbi:uncharacterized protein LOC134219642 [Armigeres subalbatus]|uniref:uncharacterized protein LOC134219642 n=1 Tax=Armigeres subalbatus TaxID=124917 RepID=UPI002ED03C79